MAPANFSVCTGADFSLSSKRFRISWNAFKSALADFFKNGRKVAGTELQPIVMGWCGMLAEVSLLFQRGASVKSKAVGRHRLF